jgi:hypothetical protein
VSSLAASLPVLALASPLAAWGTGAAHAARMRARINAKPSTILRIFLIASSPYDYSRTVMTPKQQLLQKGVCSKAFSTGKRC